MKPVGAGRGVDAARAVAAIVSGGTGTPPPPPPYMHTAPQPHPVWRPASTEHKVRVSDQKHPWTVDKRSTLTPKSHKDSPRPIPRTPGPALRFPQQQQQQWWWWSCSHFHGLGTGAGGGVHVTGAEAAPVSRGTSVPLSSETLSATVCGQTIWMIIS